MTRPDIDWPRSAGALTLELPTPALVDQVLTWRNLPEVTRWLLRTEVDPERFRSAWLDSVENPHDHAAVALREGKVVGTGSLEVGDGMGQFHGGAELEGVEGLLGYLVDPAHAGQGNATMIAAALLDLAFHDLGLRRVTAACYADNVASWKVMEKLGMRREQHGVRESWHADHGWIDNLTYAILAEEWRSRR
jgi:RimJ/RimL family protein N-acetyltransferase